MILFLYSIIILIILIIILNTYYHFMLNRTKKSISVEYFISKNENFITDIVLWNNLRIHDINIIVSMQVRF